MRTQDILRSAVEGLTRNISRSLLTTLGIIIGVGSVVLMVSLGATFQRFILDQVSTFSGNTFEIQSKGLEQFGKETNTLTEADAEALAKLSTVKNVAAVIFVAQKVKYGSEEVSPMLLGTSKEIFTNWSMKLARGRLLTDGDVKGGQSVAVVSSKTAEDLFGNADPLGKRISVGERKFTVVGVLKALGGAMGTQMDTPVYIPFTVAKTMTSKGQYVDYISLQASGNVDLASEDIKSLLRQRHNIDNPKDDPKKDDFISRSFAQATAIIGTVTLSITIFLGLIAGISLIVGGIGIMNIMLVSVSERTKEIGLRKAVGASRKDILLQFLIEAVALTVLGGLIGIVGGGMLGFLLTKLAAKFLGNLSFALTIGSVLLSVGMAVGTGLVFGLYPAQRAARLHPIEAMRFE
ncbi:MAG: ABC transporter permease [Candidatus Peribacteraceae bacterium]|nr:ABC transporter permease [Candidatus Peribacteraceae bacterium]